MTGDYKKKLQENWYTVGKLKRYVQKRLRQWFKQLDAIELD